MTIDMRTMPAPTPASSPEPKVFGRDDIRHRTYGDFVVLRNPPDAYLPDSPRTSFLRDAGAASGERFVSVTDALVGARALPGAGAVAVVAGADGTFTLRDVDHTSYRVSDDRWGGWHGAWQTQRWSEGVDSPIARGSVAILSDLRAVANRGAGAERAFVVPDAWFDGSGSDRAGVAAAVTPTDEVLHDDLANREFAVDRASGSGVPDLEDPDGVVVARVTYESGEQAIGDRGGYSSLAQAVEALRQLTNGTDVGAAVVFERTGRFFGVSTWRVESIDHDYPSYDPARFEGLGQPLPTLDFIDQPYGDSPVKVRAVVDGEVAIAR